MWGVLENYSALCNVVSLHLETLSAHIFRLCSAGKTGSGNKAILLSFVLFLLRLLPRIVQTIFGFFEYPIRTCQGKHSF